MRASAATHPSGDRLVTAGRVLVSAAPAQAEQTAFLPRTCSRHDSPKTAGAIWRHSPRPLLGVEMESFSFWGIALHSLHVSRFLKMGVVSFSQRGGALPAGW